MQGFQRTALSGVLGSVVVRDVEAARVIGSSLRRGWKIKRENDAGKCANGSRRGGASMVLHAS